MTDFQEYDRKKDHDLAQYLEQQHPSSRPFWRAVQFDAHANWDDTPCQPFCALDDDNIETDRWVGSLRLPSGSVYRINPRIGWHRFYAMIEMAYSITLGHAPSTAGGKQDQSADLLAIAWYSALKRGMTRHHGWPRGYVHRDVADANTLLGQIDIVRQLTENMGKKHRIACIYDELSFDQPVNRATQCVVDHLHRQRLFPFKQVGGSHQEPRNQLYRWRENLNMLGVEKPDNFPQQSIRWNRSNGAYRSSYELGRNLAQGKGLSSGAALIDDAIFLDAAEIWEMFLFEHLKKAAAMLLGGYTVISPRFHHRQYDALMTFNGVRRVKLIPDYRLLNAKGECVAVLDAKYRHLKSKFGRRVPSNEEVMQMALYSVVANKTQPIPCVLIYPAASKEGEAKGINPDLVNHSDDPVGKAKLHITGAPELSWWVVQLDPVEGYDKPDWQQKWQTIIDQQLKSLLENVVGLITR